jgi:hypothetical protein
MSKWRMRLRTRGDHEDNQEEDWKHEGSHIFESRYLRLMCVRETSHEMKEQRRYNR